jgi:hypothetical protein
MKLNSNNLISRSYSYIPNFIVYNILEEWFFQLCQKMPSFDGKEKIILGVKIDLS